MTDDDLAKNTPRPRQAQVQLQRKAGGGVGKSSALAAALRANLQRRKASQRAGAAKATDSAQHDATNHAIPCEPNVGEQPE
jgi:hypothetical protein